MLAAAAAITGTVTDTNGNPLAGVDVEPAEAPAYLSPDSGFAIGGFGSSTVARSNGSGHYEVKGLSPGAEVPCFFGAAVVSRCGTTSVDARAGHVVAAPKTTLVAAAQTPHGTITGTVVDAASHPVPHAVVIASAGSSGVGFASRADRNGRFTLDNLSVGPWMVCAAAGQAFGAEACRRVTVSAQHTSTVTLHLPPVGALSGLVRGPSGHRLGSVDVSAIHDAAHGTDNYDTSSDLNGAWTFTGLPPGVYRVCISSQGSSSEADPLGGRSRCLGRSFHVLAGADRLGADVTLAAAGAISGTITNGAGKPTRAGVVFYRGKGFNSVAVSTISGRDGHFRMTGLTPGLYRVCAGLTYSIGTDTFRCLSQRVAVVARKDTRGANIALPALTALTVSVTDSGGHPLAGVDVAILHRCGHNFCAVQPVFSTTNSVQVASSESTGIGGRAVFPALAPGDYAACALAYYATSSASVPKTGYADKCASNTFDITLTRGTHSAASISLDPGAAVTGIVQDSHGNPRPMCRCTWAVRLPSTTRTGTSSTIR